MNLYFDVHVQRAAIDRLASLADWEGNARQEMGVAKALAPRVVVTSWEEPHVALERNASLVVTASRSVEVVKEGLAWRAKRFGSTGRQDARNCWFLGVSGGLGVSCMGVGWVGVS